jgi:hypothetical protein
MLIWLDANLALPWCFFGAYFGSVLVFISLCLCTNLAISRCSLGYVVVLTWLLLGMPWCCLGSVLVPIWLYLYDRLDYARRLGAMEE